MGIVQTPTISLDEFNSRIDSTLVKFENAMNVLSAENKIGQLKVARNGQTLEIVVLKVGTYLFTADAQKKCLILQSP